MQIGVLRTVLDIRVGPVAARSRFGVPFAVGGLVFDRRGSAGDTLLGGDALGGSKCRGMGSKRLGEHAIGSVGPAAVMLNDLVGHMAHQELAAAGALGVNALPVPCQNKLSRRNLHY